MARTVAIRNSSKRPFTATLYHGEYCRRSQKCRCKVEYYDSSSSAGTVRGRRKNPDSIWIAPGDTLGGQHPAIQFLEQVKAAVKAKELVISFEDEDKAKTTSAVKVDSAAASVAPAELPARTGSKSRSK